MRLRRPWLGLRRPRFAFVLVAVLALLAGALALANSGPQHLGPPSATGSKPARACETAQATAERTARATLRVSGRAQLPVRITERAQRQGRLAVATMSETVAERVHLALPLTVTRTAVVQRRACAAGETAQAAKGRALTSAYRTALGAAQSLAASEARREANALLERLGPVERARARELASSRATAAAGALRPRLASAAMAAARARTASSR
ncbi:MAG: hypothetical protein JO372_03150 [Solirubrobacterales bacterium]|nr:hypothetical protein [Solirubrobacterales bacterium]